MKTPSASLQFSIVTVSYNSEKTIERTLKSVSSQDYPCVQHIAVDGCSTDNTMSLVSHLLRPNGFSLSEVDNGIYDAMNKGVSLSTGHVISFLNSDDFYFSSSVLSLVAECFSSCDVDYVYGDLLVVDSALSPSVMWSPGLIHARLPLISQIPHPTLFLRSSLLSRLDPPFDHSYSIAADLKQQLIINLNLSSSGVYIPAPLAVMRLGGKSTLKLSSRLEGLRESRRAYNEVLGFGGGVLSLAKVCAKRLSCRTLSKSEKATYSSFIGN